MFCYRGLSERSRERGFLTDICLAAQDKFGCYDFAANSARPLFFFTVYINLHFALNKKTPERSKMTALCRFFGRKILMQTVAYFYTQFCKKM